MASKIKFLMDEQVDIDVTHSLQARGVDVLTAQEAGLDHTADEVIINFALKNERVIFTQDADFLTWHQRDMPHAGIVYVHRQTAIGVIMRGLLLIHDAMTPEEMRGRVEFL